MPERGGTGLARRARGRSAAGRLLPRRLHATGRNRPDRLPEQGGDLRPAAPRRGRDAADDRCSPAPRLIETPRMRTVSADRGDEHEDRKSTRLNSSHANISYAVFCLKKKKTNTTHIYTITNCP